MKTGDAIHAFVNPVALGIDAIWGSDLANCTGCRTMRDNLNSGMSLQDAVYQRWFAAKQQGEQMKFQITVVIEKEKLGDAVQAAETIGEVISAQARPQPQVQPTRPVSIMQPAKQ